jgi:hypothetical protein
VSSRQAIKQQAIKLLTLSANISNIEVAKDSKGGISEVNREQVCEMLKRDRLEWEALTRILDTHPGESLHDPRTPIWISRDVYAHLARWNEHSNINVKAYCTGRSLTSLEGTDEEINARWRQEDSCLSLDEARQKARKAFKQRMRIIRAIPENLWDIELEKIVHFDGYTHYAAHRGYIRFTG